MPYAETAAVTVVNFRKGLELNKFEYAWEAKYVRLRTKAT
jgi:hypothetical protein